ncbi:MAG: four helix bundle protein [Bacteroidota bacterium]
MHDFRKLTVWIDSLELAKEIYKATRSFSKEEAFGLTHQIKKSAVSIPSNIAEGAGRNSNAEFNQFLGYATGSTYELETQLILSEKLGFLSSEELHDFLEDLQSIQKRIYSLKSSLVNQKR